MEEARSSPASKMSSTPSPASKGSSSSTLVASDYFSPASSTTTMANFFEDDEISIHFTKETHRCGRPLLMPLPLWSKDAPETIREKYAMAKPIIESRICDFIRKEDIASIDVCSRYQQDNEDILVLALLVITKLRSQANSDNWMKCIDNLQALLKEYGLQGITVEIIAENLTLPREMAAMEPSHPFKLAWETYLQRQILDLIATKYEELDRLLLSLDLVQFAFCYDEWHDWEAFPTECQTPFTITVSGTVDRSADEAQWIDAQKDIDSLIRQEGFYDVAVEFERGQIDCYATAKAYGFPSIPKDTEKADAGALIGSNLRVYNLATGEESSGVVGTMGGYLVLEEDGHRRIVGVTNYHVLRGATRGWALNHTGGEKQPADGTPLKYFDSNPLFDTDKERGNIKLEFPSTRNILVKIDEVNGRLNKNWKKSKMKDYQDEKARLTALLNSGRTLAVPYMASSLKRESANHHRLNWALLEIPRDRRGRNIDIDDELIQGIRSPEDIPLSDSVFKRGGISGDKEGEFTSQSAVRRQKPFQMDVHAAFPGEKIPITEEFAIVIKGTGTSGQFARGGDSGSFITYNGEWVGVLWGGNTKQNAKNTLVYMTPAKDVLDDIHDLAASRNRIVEARLPTEADMAL